MIKNERQYAVTKKQVKLFEEALAEFTAEHGLKLADPLKRAQSDALESQLDDLREQLRDYESLLAGGPKLGTRRPLAELSDALIEARIASGLTQKQLAERLEMKEQQVQRYEANDYVSASLGRLLDVANALDAFSFTFQLQRPNESLLTMPTQGSSGIIGSFDAPARTEPWSEPPLAALTYAHSPRWDPPAMAYTNAKPTLIGRHPEQQGVIVLLGGEGPGGWQETPGLRFVGGSFRNVGQQEAPTIWMVGNSIEVPRQTRGESIRIGAFPATVQQPSSVKGRLPALEAEVRPGQPAG